MWLALRAEHFSAPIQKETPFLVLIQLRWSLIKLMTRTIKNLPTSLSTVHILLLKGETGELDEPSRVGGERGEALPRLHAGTDHVHDPI